MKKAFFLLVCLGYLTCSAQKKVNFLKVHGGAELTTGLFAEGYKTGWGVYLTDYFGVGNTTNILLSTGIASWNAKDESPVKVGMSLTRFGIQQFLYRGLYVQADGGIGIGLKDWSGTSKFALGAEAGYLIKTGSSGGISFSGRINRSFNRTWIGLGAGYQFRF